MVEAGMPPVRCATTRPWCSDAEGKTLNTSSKNPDSSKGGEEEGAAGDEASNGALARRSQTVDRMEGGGAGERVHAGASCYGWRVQGQLLKSLRAAAF